jgi:large subunit ribosomal protein L33
MAKSKSVRIVITLECRSVAGVYRYTPTKNRRNTPNKMELKKYCPLSKKHEIFKEIK